MTSSKNLSNKRPAAKQNENLDATSSESPWHKSAPQCVRILCRTESDKAPCSAKQYEEAWQQWGEYLRTRKSPVPLAKLLPGKTNPLTWALPDDLAPPCSDGSCSDRSCSDEIEFDPSDDELLQQWLDATEHDCSSIAHALESLAWCHALPSLADRLSPERWWELLQRLISVAVEASELLPVEHGVLSQLAGGELALSLAYLFPEITPCRKLVKQARAVLSVGLVDLLDGQGLPHAEGLAALRLLLACWTRCRAMGSNWKKGCFNTTAEEQFQWLIRQALRLTRPDGSQVFSQTSDDTKSEAADAEKRRCRDLFTAALLFGDDDDRDIAGTVLPKWFKKPGESKLPEASYRSEWSAAAVLRPDWSASGVRLTALYDGRSDVDIELSSGRNVIFSGQWQWEVAIDGKTLEPLSDWEEICWVSDEDADYIELELALSEDVVLQRHILMARQDGFMLMADSVLCEEESAKKPKIEYRAVLPLGPDIAFEPNDETHEVLLTTSKKNLAQILPLAFPEWREAVSPGTLELTPDGLELKFSVEGSALFAPLFFDLDPRRFARRLTWRRLTIAESLEIQPADVAVGYRVQLGKEQWLVYRSLAQQANRTLLGHNLSTEMLVARFDPTGEVEALVEIE